MTTSVLLAWFACSEQAPDASVPIGESTVELLVPEEPDTPPPPTPISARISFVGAGDTTPRLVSVQLDRPLFEPSEIGTTPTSFTLQLEPAVAGALTVAGPAALEFVPATPLRPATRYEVTLTRTAEPPTGGPWEARVDTPEFGLSRANLRRLGPPGTEIVVDLVFTAAVDPSTARKAIHATIGDVALTPRLEAGADPNVIVATLRRPQSDQAELTLVLDDDEVPWAFDAALRAPGTEHTVSLKSGPRMQILHAALEEGQDGWIVDVVCDDDGAPGPKRWHQNPRWDTGFEVSPRCELDEDFARTMVHTDSKADLSFATSDAGFRVFGNFPRGPMELSIDAGATTVDGGVLQDTWEMALDVPARTPRARFADQGRYLPRSAWKNLAVRHLNVDRLGVEVRHVPRENLVFWMTGDEPLARRTSNRVVSTAVTVPNTPDVEVTSFLSVSSLVHDPKPGVYEIKIGTTGSARILLTDLHLVAKADAPTPEAGWTPKITVWALDVHTGEALSGVEVSAVRASGQSLATCRTAGDAGCTLGVRSDAVDDSPPVALIATRGDDLTYIALADLRLAVPEDVGGRPYTATVPYQAPLWTDRGVYRPGDTAHVAAIVRNEAFVAPPADLPVVLRMYDPKERESRKKVATTNAAGMIGVDFRFGDYAGTGRYRVVAEIGGETVGETTFQVEEFVPERLKVTASSSPQGTDEPVPVEVSGQWLFGGSAEGAKVEVACRIEAAPFTAPGFDGWSFGPAWLDGPPPAVTLGTVEGELDTDGNATLDCPAAGPGGARGPAELVADAAVFEGESGRTTTAHVRSRVHPERWVLGVTSAADKARGGQTMPFRGVVVGWSGAPATGLRQATVEVFRMEEEYSWTWDDAEGSSSHRRQLRPAREQKQTVPIVDGKFSFDVVPAQDSAGTLVRVTAGKAVTERFVEGVGTRWEWGESPGAVVDATPRPVRPTALPIAVQGPVKVGDVVPVVVTAPYPGRLLYTVETDEVVEAQWVDAVAGPNTWSFTVDAFVPNVYVSAFLVKDPHLESPDAFLPDRAFGVAPLKVVPEVFTRTLTIDAPDTTKPFQKLTVGVQLSGAGPGFVTIAAVDEGILSLTGFPDPDPLGTLFARRALGVSSFETVGWTRMVAASGSSSSTGGDAEEEPASGQRVQMVKPVALWSGVVPLDADGKAQVTFDVPGYRGKLRVMAVAATADGIGQATDEVLVRDPLVLMTTLPRFLLAGDEAHIPVRVTNLTGAAREVTVALEATELQRGAVPDAVAGLPLPPPLVHLGEPPAPIQLPANGSETVVFRVRVRPMPGAAHLLVTAKAGKFHSKEMLDVPIQVARSEVREVTSIRIEDAVTDVLPSLRGWAEGSDKSTLWVTANPYSESLVHLRYLVDYPFG